MARQRMVSPGFFTDEELATVSPLARLLFIGLWTIADRRGRLEDRPVRVKVQVLPYDEADIEALLGELAAGRFIQRYEVDGRRLIQIRTFEQHQHPHVKEPESTLPAPGLSGASTGPAPDRHGSGPAESESESESESENGRNNPVMERGSSLDDARERLDRIAATLDGNVLAMPRRASQ